MALIQNKDVGAYTLSKNTYCNKCGNRGRIKVVQEVDKEKFEKEFDWHYCPDCEEGQKYKDKYPIYQGL